MAGEQPPARSEQAKPMRRSSSGPVGSLRSGSLRGRSTVAWDMDQPTGPLALRRIPRGARPPQPLRLGRLGLKGPLPMHRLHHNLPPPPPVHLSFSLPLAFKASLFSLLFVILRERAPESHSAGSVCHLRRRRPWCAAKKLLCFGARFRFDFRLNGIKRGVNLGIPCFKKVRCALTIDLTLLNRAD